MPRVGCQSGKDFEFFGGNDGVTSESCRYRGSLKEGKRQEGLESSQRSPREWRLGLTRSHPCQVDAFVGLLAFEEAGNKFDDTRDVDLLNSVKSSTTEEP